MWEQVLVYMCKAEPTCVCGSRLCVHARLTTHENAQPEPGGCVGVLLFLSTCCLRSHLVPCSRLGSPDVVPALYTHPETPQDFLL